MHDLPHIQRPATISNDPLDLVVRQGWLAAERVVDFDPVVKTKLAEAWQKHLDSMGWSDSEKVLTGEMFWKLAEAYDAYAKLVEEKMQEISAVYTSPPQAISQSDMIALITHERDAQIKKMYEWQTSTIVKDIYHTLTETT